MKCIGRKIEIFASKHNGSQMPIFNFSSIDEDLPDIKSYQIGFYGDHLPAQAISYPISVKVNL